MFVNMSTGSYSVSREAAGFTQAVLRIRIQKICIILLDPKFFSTKNKFVKQ